MKLMTLTIRCPWAVPWRLPISRGAVEDGVTCYFQDLARDTFMSQEIVQNGSQ